ncbi:kinase-like domain-containing protein [Phakopsora pachyrhizi]|uniref:cyclin-dependent kinase n=1 Tax=Phakopsora pachyrhizi TaxID=170000 RepID=A0AAV0BA59_PHAPC|nr:kinase-like domain-containing protein [Phakopsora pachyrhizi]
MSDYFYRITRIIFKDLAGALNYLHGLGIGHRDLSPSNIALDFGFRAILLDFGTVWDPRFREQGGSKLDFELGTMPYRAPELLFGSQDYSVTGIDLWSLGTILAEFFTPLEPIEEYHKRELSFQGDEYDNSKSQLSDNAFDWYCGGYGDNQKRSNKLRRRNLFRGDIGDIGLVGSIFKILGTPDNDSWPESKSLPDFSKLEFHKFEVKDLRDNLPYLHSVEDENKESGNENNEISLLIDLIKGLLKLSSSKRLKADQVLEHPWLKDKKLDLDDYSKTEISKLWKTL